MNPLANILASCVIACGGALVVAVLVAGLT